MMTTIWRKFRNVHIALHYSTRFTGLRAARAALQSQSIFDANGKHQVAIIMPALLANLSLLGDPEDVKNTLQRYVDVN